jgi:hypothetical protein
MATVKRVEMNQLRCANPGSIWPEAAAPPGPGPAGPYRAARYRYVAASVHVVMNHRMTRAQVPQAVIATTQTDTTLGQWAPAIVIAPATMQISPIPTETGRQARSEVARRSNPFG